MKFAETYVANEDRWWIGQENDSGRYYLAIPVSNRRVDYSESYWITDVQHRQFSDNHDLAFDFAEACRRREHDALLVYQPGTDRGTPR
jgi:hypothetical protein